MFTCYGSCHRRVPELCENRGGRPGLPVLMSLMVMVSVYEKQHWTMLTHWSQFVPNNSNMSTQHPRTLSSTSSLCCSFSAGFLCNLKSSMLPLVINTWPCTNAMEKGKFYTVSSYDQNDCDILCVKNTDKHYTLFTCTSAACVYC